MGLSVATQPAEETVSLAEQYLHMRVEDTDVTDGGDEDSLIQGLITAARIYCEDIQGRSYVNTTYDLTLSAYAPIILIPRSPLSSVTSITYIDTNGATQPVSTDVYHVKTDLTTGMVIRKPNESWPSDVSTSEVDPITVRFVAGYGEAGDVPDTFKIAIKMLAASWYENRESVSEKQRYAVPMAVENLLQFDRASFV